MTSFYTDPENQIIQLLIRNTFFNLDEDTCGISIDKVYTGIVEKNARFGCHLSFGGAGKQPQETFGNTGLASMGMGNKFVKRTFGILFIRYLGDNNEVEVTTRQAIDELAGIMKDANDRRLYGTVAVADIVAIDPVEGIDINDIPFYAIGFTIEMWSKS